MKKPPYYTGPRPEPLQAHGGIKAESHQGGFGKSWWARRWQSILDSFRIGGRLVRGRTYARQGQVLSIDFHLGEVKARVQGSQPEPYNVTMAVKRLDDEEWDQVLEVLKKQALFVAKLLAGEMPQDIERVFKQAGVSLFPRQRGDLKTKCSCPDQVNPCKHIAAVYYLLGEEFDRDPFLIFRLRGLERQDLLARLGTAGKGSLASDEPSFPPEPLSAQPDEFWKLPPLAEDFHGEVHSPPVSAALVRRLGKFPLWRGERPLVDVIEPTYIQASAKGLESFLGEKTE